MGRSWKAEQLYFGFTCRNFGPCGVQVEPDREGIKNCWQQKQNCNLAPSALFTSALAQSYHKNQLIVTPNENGGPLIPYTHWMTCCQFLRIVPSTRILLANAVYIVLGSSQYNDLSTSQRGGFSHQEDPNARDKDNPLNVN